MNTRDLGNTLPTLFAGLIDGNTVVGSVAHLAYHVGAIRQIDLSARGPSAHD